PRSPSRTQAPQRRLEDRPDQLVVAQARGLADDAQIREARAQARQRVALDELDPAVAVEAQVDPGDVAAAERLEGPPRDPSELAAEGLVDPGGDLEADPGLGLL